MTTTVPTKVNSNFLLRQKEVVWIIPKYRANESKTKLALVLPKYRASERKTKLALVLPKYRASERKTKLALVLPSAADIQRS